MTNSRTVHKISRWFVVAVHIVSMICLLFGWYFYKLFPPYLILHSIIYVVIIYYHTRYHICPLTKLEKYFIKKSGSRPYKGGFYEHYFFGKLLRIKKLPPKTAGIVLFVTKLLPGLIPFVQFFSSK